MPITWNEAARRWPGTQVQYFGGGSDPIETIAGRSGEKEVYYSEGRGKVFFYRDPELAEAIGATLTPEELAEQERLAQEAIRQGEGWE